MVKPKTTKGRPTKYQKSYDEQARKLCLLGYIDTQLADFFEVAESTIHQWKLDHPSFSESLKRGKVVADANVVASLYERATGYSHVEEKVFCPNGEVVTHNVTKQYPPDPISIKYWLNNRQNTQWREKVESDETKPQDTSITINLVDAVKPE